MHPAFCLSDNYKKTVDIHGEKRYNTSQLEVVTLKTKEELSAAQTQYQKKYDKEHTIRYGLKLNKQTDADLIAWLDQQDSKQGAMKAAMRRLMMSTQASDT